MNLNVDLKHAIRSVLDLEKDTDLFSGVVIMDEISVHFCHPKTKRKTSMESRHSGSPWPKIFRIENSGKVPAAVFWDCQGVVLFDFLDKHGPQIWNYYSKQTTKTNLERKRAGSLLQDKVPAFKQPIQTTHHSGFELLNYPDHSSDLASSGLVCLFPAEKSFETS